MDNFDFVEKHLEIYNDVKDAIQNICIGTIENIKREKLRFSWASLTEGIGKLMIND